MAYYAGSFRSSVVNAMQTLGLIDIILPFTLVFTIVYAVMQKITIFDTDKTKNRKYSIVLGVVMGALFVTPHIMGTRGPFGVDPVQVINGAIPQVGLLAVAIIMIMILLGIMGFKAQGTGWASTMALFCFFFVIYIFGYSVGWFTYLPDFLWFLRDPDFQALLIVLLVFGLIVYFVTKEPGTPTTDPSATIGKWVNKFMGENNN